MQFKININPMKYLTILCSLLICSILHGHIYEYITVRKEFIFSDRPPIEAQISNRKIKIENLNSLISSVGHDIRSLDTKSLNQAISRSIEIMTPPDQYTFWNEKQIPIRLLVLPSLNAHEKIEILVNGSSHQILQKNGETCLENISPGTHTIQAVLTSPNGEAISRSKMITIFVHQGNTSSPPSNKDFSEDYKND